MTSFLQWLGAVEDYEPSDTVYASDYLEENEPPENGTVIQLYIDSSQLSTRVVLVDAASWAIPSIGVSQEGYAHGGFVGTIADLLDKLKRDIDMMRDGYAEDSQRNIDEFLARVDVILQGRVDSGDGKSQRCHLTITDPSGLSCVIAENDSDGNGDGACEWLTYTSYSRSFIDNDDLGLIPSTYKAIDPAAQLTTARQIAELVSTCKRVVCISGAGISVESGIPPFRSRGIYNTGADSGSGKDDSIWGNFNAARMTLQGFNTDLSVAKEWWEMKHNYIPKFNSALPNPAHSFFAFLQDRGQLHQVITQNVDSLHQKAGVSDERVQELHGHMRGLICSDKTSPYNPQPRHTGECSFSLSEAESCEVNYFADNPLPLCPLCQQPLRTETVMFGQPLPAGSLERAIETIGEADLLFIIGSSLVVQPVNTLPDIALRRGVPVVMINLDDTQYDTHATALIREPAGQFLAEVKECMS